MLLCLVPLQLTNSETPIALLSPDAYIQMALQLAWYRTHGTFTATYETALTRLFEHGRTETIRALTAESRQFVLSMCDPNTSVRLSSSSLRINELTNARTRRTRHARHSSVKL